ncbi:hypothetical protein [Aeromonas veronii]|uniref:hypothetical protein n=1 Tax=Aeromonas veronii TaxID=654 RepID=UPI003B9FC7C6
MGIIVRQKKWLYILCVSCALYIVYPFINGVGCNFTGAAEDSERVVYMTCFSGLMKKVYLSKKTNKIIIIDSIYGKIGNTVLLIPVDISSADGYLGGNKMASFDLVSFLIEYVDMPLIMSFVIFERKGIVGDIVLWDSPVMKIYVLHRVGQLSMF